MKWVLLLLSFPCYAGSMYQTYHKDMKASTEIMSRASKFVQICSIPVKNVSKGEVLKAHSTMTTTNDTGLVVGVTAEVHWCDPRALKCYRRIVQTDSNQRDGGNVTPQEHHKVYKPTARLKAIRNYPILKATAVLVVYSTGKAVGQRLNVDMCDIDIERQTNG